MIDARTAKVLSIYVLPAAVVGALVSHWAPEMVLRIVYSVMMLVAAWLLVRRNSDAKQPQHESCPQGESRELTDVEGETYRFCAHGLKLQRSISGGGALLTGLISTGIGEVTVPGLIVRSGFPVPIAAATSLVLVAVADISAVLLTFLAFTIVGE